MFNLADTQKAFIEKLFTYKGFPENVASSYPAERFHVYRQSIFETCRRTLALTFPEVWKTLEKEGIAVDNVVGHFLKERTHWPSSGCLDDWGEKFPVFLEFFCQSLTLKDLAQYEWLSHVANGQSELPSLCANDLMFLSETEQMNVRLHFQPSFFMHHLLSSSRWMIMIKVENKLMTYDIKNDWAIFLKKLQEGDTITEAYDAVASRYQDFDLTGVLAFLLNKKLCQKLCQNSGI